MSAFICPNEHIDTIASWAAANCTDRLSKSPSVTAALLFAENVRSVNFRYRMRQRTGSYTFRQRMKLAQVNAALATLTQTTQEIHA